MPPSGAKKIGSNREKAPRVHPVLVVFTFGARIKQELPFIMGVMSDLTGKAPSKPIAPSTGATDEEQRQYEVDLRKYEAYQNTKKNFLEFNTGNFESRMQAMRPKVTFNVPNRLNSQGMELPVSIEFESMEDFMPDKAAMKVGPLKELMEQREKLQTLLSHMNGNPNLEAALEDLLQHVRAV